MIDAYADRVVRTNLTEACKNTIPVRLAGNLAAGLHGLDASWNFADAFKALDTCEPSDPCKGCGLSESRHTGIELDGCNNYASEGK